MDIPAYLNRIGITERPAPTAANLTRLQRAHLYAVPFENLDISLGRPIQLTEAALVDKIITHRRGGFCYELNGLFGRLLEALGYQVERLNARGINDDGALSRDFDHLALAVTCPDDPASAYLVDVGWGNGPLEPLRLAVAGVPVGQEQCQGSRVFQLVSSGSYLNLQERADHLPGWIQHYAFILQPHAYEEFFDCCHYHQTSPDSIFTQKRICSLFLPDGRVTLTDHKLIFTRNGQREERALGSEDDFQRALREQFRMDL